MAQSKLALEADLHTAIAMQVIHNDNSNPHAE
jgi:hypothetical protein